jgi:DeoR family fructose operon transcriptional repressor
MIACARKTVVLADSTKIGVETAVRFATLDSLDVLVTDSDIEPADRRALEAAGIEVVVA